MNASREKGTELIDIKPDQTLRMYRLQHTMDGRLVIAHHAVGGDYMRYLEKICVFQRVEDGSK